MVGLMMVSVQLGFRTWAIHGSWFYEDDYDYMLRAQDSDLTINYLLSPHGGHVLPLTRLLAWLTVRWSDSFADRFGAAALSIVALQSIASLAALWALLLIFGKRWWVLAPLALYLCSALTMPAFMWWAAAMNQLGHQAGLFLAAGGWIAYQRSRRVTWLLVPLTGLLLSLFCDVRGLFVIPLLAMISFGWFTEGRPLRRIRTLLSRDWVACVTLVGPLIAYVVYYVRHAPNVASAATPEIAGDLANSMLANALGSGLVGGPWVWDAASAPSAAAAPPDWVTHLAWVVIALAIAFAHLTRERAFRPLLLLAIYVSALYALLLTSRATEVGDVAGMQYRYLADVGVVGALALGLMFLGLPGSSQGSVPRARPLLTLNGNSVGVVLVIAVTVSSMASSFSYARLWHGAHTGKAYTTQLSREIADLHPVDLAAGKLPESVVSGLVWPDRRMERLNDLMPTKANFPESTHRLGIVGDDGTIHAALIASGLRSQPGPVPGCGWKIDDGSLRIPLTGEAFAWGWWMRIGYLAPTATDVVIRAGGTVVESRLRAGLNSLYVRNEGGFDNVYIGGIDPGVTVCVDTIEVGEPAPGRPLR